MIGENIKNFRKKKPLTQEELGDILSVSAAMVSQWERGERNPKGETLEKIAKALDVSVTDLTQDELDKYYFSILQRAGTTTIDGLAHMLNIDYERCLFLLNGNMKPTQAEDDKLKLLSGYTFKDFIRAEIDFNKDLKDTFSQNNVANEQIEMFEEYLKSLTQVEIIELLKSLNFTTNSFKVIDSEIKRTECEKRLTQIIKNYGVLIRLSDEGEASNDEFYKIYEGLLTLIEDHRRNLSKVPEYQKDE
ncbi:helix-turn-helix transcriptional regulator [Eubacteriaceae bacterium ES3]|nr:helix-turn-helix transcriptional regulator [Eubacteriaceae bacterium ES3]